jgi:SulP family sulfate permease
VNAPWPRRRLVRVLGPWVERVSRASLRADLVAGLLGAVLVLPQAIAFATLAGLPPQYGLYTAVVPCVVAALAGSSWHVVSGPTNANSIALAAMLAPLAVPFTQPYVHLALTVTILVGLMQFAIGALRLGTLSAFISPATLLGFTSGAAVLIAVYALKDGLGFGALAGHGAGAIAVHAVTHLSQAAPGAVLVAVATLAVSVAVRAVNRRLPFLLIGLAAGTALAVLLNRQAGAWHVDVLGTVPSPWPAPSLPQLDWSRLPDLLGLGIALTIVALGQSISIARAIASRSGQHIDANREFVGQGLSNIVGGLFSSYVSCGSLNRSAPNYESGARTPLAAVFSAVLLLALVAVLGPVLALIPFAAIAGLLWLVAAGLLDLPRWRRLARLHRADFGIAAATFVATVSIRLEVAILLGTILSLLGYLQRTSRPAMRTLGFDSTAPERPFVPVVDAPGALPECPQLKLLRMEGSVYFGAVPHVSGRLQALREPPGAPRHLLVMAKSMNFVDLAGAELWEHELRSRRALGGDLYFHRPRPQVLHTWQRIGFVDELGRDHLFEDKRSAIASIFARLDRRICATCRVRVFHECAALPPPEDAAPQAEPASDQRPPETSTKDPVV